MSRPIITCPHCGTDKAISGSACSSCGSLDQSVAIEPVGVGTCGKVGNVGKVAEERDASRAQARILLQTPAGAHSDTLLTDGVVSLNIHGAIEIGRNGEPRALDTLLRKLQEGGHQPILEAGRDQHGEDGILLLQGLRLTLQVVTVPSCPKWWRDANRDSAMTAVPVVEGANWIRDAVVAKLTNTSPAERETTILVLDVGLTGILAEHEVVDAYLELYGDPNLEFRFASIWLVGPTTSTTTQLGT